MSELRVKSPYCAVRTEALNALIGKAVDLVGEGIPEMVHDRSDYDELWKIVEGLNVRATHGGDDE